MTAQEIKEDIERYDSIQVILEQYRDELRFFRENENVIEIDSVQYYLGKSDMKRTLAFHPYRIMSVQTVMDVLGKCINDIDRELAKIMEKYEGVIDFTK